MSSSFVCILFPVPIDKDNNKINLHYDLALKTVQETDWENTDYFRDYFSEEHNSNDVRIILTKAIEDLRNVIENDNRNDVAIIFRPTEMLIITGGETWGDTPTDFYTTLEHLENSGISDVLRTGEPLYE